MTDLIAHLEQRLDEAREDAATAYSRVDALEHLVGFAIRTKAELNVRELTPEQLFAAPADVEQRAGLDALIARAELVTEGS